MASRVEFVAKFYRGRLLDVGIGSGAFINKRNGSKTGLTLGYDINPAGKTWLHERWLWLDPYEVKVHAVSMWDVLEHIKDFRPLLANVEKWLFIALPLFRNVEHVLKSKHFRKNEHFWYYEKRGLVSIMQMLGFDLVEYNQNETLLGREDIGSFAFKRSHDGVAEFNGSSVWATESHQTKA